MRKHHNRLYFGLYTNKVVFRMPWACYLYPTTDQHLNSVLEHREEDFKSERALRDGKWLFFFKHSKNLIKLASFILHNRKNMKFRIQNMDCVVYCKEEMARDLVTSFWQEWTNADQVAKDRSYLLNRNNVLCKRLPLGQYQYQVHLKKNVHRILKQSQREDLYRYLNQNPDNCLITGKYVKEYLEGTSQYGWQGYFYVRDEKMLTPIYMIAHDAIERVIKFVKVSK